jgi:hypothetical protein
VKLALHLERHTGDAAPAAARHAPRRRHRRRSGRPPVASHAIQRAVNNRLLHRPVSVYRFRRRALTLCPQPCMGIQLGARFPAPSAGPLPATLYGHFTQAIYRDRPIKRYYVTWRAIYGRALAAGARITGGDTGEPDLLVGL